MTSDFCEEYGHRLTKDNLCKRCGLQFISGRLLDAIYLLDRVHYNVLQILELTETSYHIRGLY